MMPNHFKAERQRLCVKFAIEINKLCNKCVSGLSSKWTLLVELNFEISGQLSFGRGDVGNCFVEAF
jgi:hypothetical protein